MACWQKLESGVLTGPIINTYLSEKIEAEGDYVLLPVPSGLDAARPALLAAMVTVAGHTATVQLWGGVGGARTNVGGALTPTNGSPAMLTDEITLTGMRGITVSSLTGGVLVEVTQ